MINKVISTNTNTSWLKIIALITMTCDHIGKMFFSQALITSESRRNHLSISAFWLCSNRNPQFPLLLLHRYFLLLRSFLSLYFPPFLILFFKLECVIKCSIHLIIVFYTNCFDLYQNLSPLPVFPFRLHLIITKMYYRYIICIAKLFSKYVLIIL